MTRTRLAIVLVLVLVACSTLGAVVVTGERQRAAATGPASTVTAVEPVATPSARPHPTTTHSHPAPSAPPAPRPSATPTPTAEPTPRSTPEPTTKPKPKAPARAGSAPSATRGRVVYLTFDDGPGEYTPQVLDVLRRTGSTATFFQLGVNAQGQRTLQAAIRRQGSSIGNHTWNHPDLTRLGAAELRRQIADGPRSRCVRPPYGATNAAVRAAIARAGAHQVLWTVDSRDWTKPGMRNLERLGSSSLVRPGSIVLMHDGGGDRRQTVAALPTIIERWQARGYVVRGLPSCR